VVESVNTPASLNTPAHARLAALREQFAEAGIDALLVTTPANVRYLTNFTSSQDGMVLVTKEAARLLTDGRYIAQAGEESWLTVDILTGETRRDWHAYVTNLVSGRLGVEAAAMTLAEYQVFKDKTNTSPTPTHDLVENLRLYKSPEEIATLREAAKLTDEAFSHILNVIRPGIKEVDVALELERYMRAHGAEDKSFDIIVASGVRSAMPHGLASQKVINTGELVTLDFGAKVGGYHADMTRTVAVGKLSDAHRARYEVVLDAQVKALNAIAPHKDGKEVDAVAREVFKQADLEQYFSHSLGHGVGLEIHEQPSLSPVRSYMLAPTMTATIEPGVYLPGDAGVRIEDLVVVTDDGFELLSHSDKGLLEL
jgi:Xaa-Pro aminopeptidase